MNKLQICVSTLVRLVASNYGLTPAALVALTLFTICAAQTGNDAKEPGLAPDRVGTAQSKEAVRARLVGAWKLVSFESRRPDGEISRQDSVGYLLYDANGIMSAQIMRLGPRGSAAGDIRSAPGDRPYVAYFGPYEINEKEGVVIHHMQGNLDPDLVGKDFIRYYDIDGDKLILTPTNIVDGKLRPKSASRLRLIWQRVK